VPVFFIYMDKKQKLEILKLMHRAMDSYVEENKHLYSPLEQQEQLAIVTMFVAGYLPQYLEKEL